MEMTKDKKLQVDAFVIAIGPAATGNFLSSVLSAWQHIWLKSSRKIFCPT